MSFLQAGILGMQGTLGSPAPTPLPEPFGGAKAPGLSQGTEAVERPHEFTPWSGMAERTPNPMQPTGLNAANNAAAGIPGALAGLNQQMSDFQSKLASYPSFPNQLGLGSQNPFGQAEPGATSRGFNPWSLMGEANSR